jgi:hypothetical protein
MYSDFHCNFNVKVSYFGKNSAADYNKRCNGQPQWNAPVLNPFTVLTALAGWFRLIKPKLGRC